MDKVIYNSNFENEINTILSNKFAIICQDIVDEAKTIVPIDTGKLQNDIGILSKNGLEAEIGTKGSEYALFVELGTSKQTPQPFLRNAVNNVLQKKL